MERVLICGLKIDSRPDTQLQLFDRAVARRWQMTPHRTGAEANRVICVRCGQLDVIVERTMTGCLCTACGTLVEARPSGSKPHFDRRAHGLALGVLLRRRLVTYPRCVICLRRRLRPDRTQPGFGGASASLGLSDVLGEVGRVRVAWMRRQGRLQRP